MQPVAAADAAQLADDTFIKTEDSVSVALQTCKAYKACGPDRLGNDWYRSYGVLWSLFSHSFSSCGTANVFPASFLEADIFCLKTAGDSANPLNYRPLALLDSDYKLLTRLLATQVRETLSVRISHFQNGFITGHQIQATLDYFTVAQGMATCSPEA
ncbi:hypothetical protein PC116_g20492 [Phytophthora cactorum]|uniref:Uncharacterized protein n=1 Tax=Phytophthora cactorum TaxID=29920 RepID=A0A329RK23_9STRA|nr:hypothetical protein PC114_g20394 [Phytophthora cactorum]KAG2986664.1 hypothetical protein PC119_g19843 [Phytophthora cactorum]KAG3133401.1 hypothetical protein C6341_g22549 [Phytophthora cactorum]KAG4231228.1 hypothetical protein PC116_g20492 [Phytophthora cactorum]RAW23548.1 hypothetical protein PC110_g20020 [Phytophthora cactorum]